MRQTEKNWGNRNFDLYFFRFFAVVFHTVTKMQSAHVLAKAAMEL